MAIFSTKTSVSLSFIDKAHGCSEIVIIYCVVNFFNIDSSFVSISQFASSATIARP